MYFSTDVAALAEEIRKAEPLITASRKEQVVHLILRLQEKLGEQEDHKFYLFKVRGLFRIISMLFLVLAILFSSLDIISVTEQNFIPMARSFALFHYLCTAVVA